MAMFMTERINRCSCGAWKAIQATGLPNGSIGAPNLTDAIWLYGGDRDTLEQVRMTEDEVVRFLDDKVNG